MLLEELHDQSPPLVQGAAQRRVGHLVELQLPQDVLPIRSWENTHTERREERAERSEEWEKEGPGHIYQAKKWTVCVGVFSLPGRSKVKMSPSHLAALLGVLGSELQLDRRRLFLLGDTGSSVDESRSGGGGQMVQQSISTHFI